MYVPLDFRTVGILGEYKQRRSHTDKSFSNDRGLGKKHTNHARESTLARVLPAAPFCIAWRAREKSKISREQAEERDWWLTLFRPTRKTIRVYLRDFFKDCSAV